MRKSARLFQDVDFMQREMERLFSDMWGRQPGGMFCPRAAWRPPTDVYETATGLMVKMELANMREREIDVLLDDRTLTISGFRPDDHPPERISYYQMGVNYGHFCVQIFLPWPVQEDAVVATYEDGFLKIRLPRRTLESGAARHVTIKVREPE